MARTKVSRLQFLTGRQACPFHQQCSEDWEITDIESDICVREKGGTVRECPSLTAEGGTLAYHSLATDGPGPS